MRLSYRLTTSRWISDLPSFPLATIDRYLLTAMTSDYGTYRLTFEPPADQITPSVELTLSGEANVDQMLALFEAFLQASGYVLKGELQIVEPTAPRATTYDALDFGDDGFSFVGNPFASSYSPDTISFAGAGIYGGMAEDIIKF